MSYKILIIDHDLTSADAIRGQLTEAGYEAVVAESAAEGRKAFERDRPDLTLIEVQLPKKPGFELCRELKQSCGGDEVRVVLVGDESSLQDVAEIAQSGCDELIQKPVDNERLTAVCEVLLTSTTGVDVEEDVEGDVVAEETPDENAEADDEAVAETPTFEPDDDEAVAEAETGTVEEAVDEDRTEADAAMLGRSDVNDAMGQLESIVVDETANRGDGDSGTDETVDAAAPIGAAEAAGDFSHILMETESSMNRDRPEQEAYDPAADAPAAAGEGPGLLSGVEEGEDIEAHLDSLFSGTSASTSPPPPQPVVPRSVDSTSEVEPAESVNVAAEAEEVASAKPDNLVVWENLDSPADDPAATGPQATMGAPEPSSQESAPAVLVTQFSSPSQTARIDEPLALRADDRFDGADEPPVNAGIAVEPASGIPSTDVDAPASSSRGLMWIAIAAVVVVAIGGSLWLMRSPSTESPVLASGTSTPAGDSRAPVSSPVTPVSPATPTPFAGLPAVPVEASEPAEVGGDVAATTATPVVASKPTTPSTEPVATAKPTSTTKPVAASNPVTSSTKPVTTTKPARTTKPVAAAKSAPKTTEPVAAAKPASPGTEPVAAAKPSPKTTEPVVTSKPATTGTPSVATTAPAAAVPETTPEPSKPEPAVAAPTPKPSSTTQSPEPAPVETGLKPPVVLERVEPIYPPKALKRGGGTVVLSVLVNEKGGISRVVVEEGLSGSELEAAAIGAVLRWRYEPATENGKPVRAWATARFVFEP